MCLLRGAAYKADNLGDSKKLHKKEYLTERERERELENYICLKFSDISWEYSEFVS